MGTAAPLPLRGSERIVDRFPPQREGHPGADPDVLPAPDLGDHGRDGHRRRVGSPLFAARRALPRGRGSRDRRGGGGGLSPPGSRNAKALRQPRLESAPARRVQDRRRRDRGARRAARAPAGRRRVPAGRPGGRGAFLPLPVAPTGSEARALRRRASVPRGEGVRESARGRLGAGPANGKVSAGGRGVSARTVGNEVLGRVIASAVPVRQ